MFSDIVRNEYHEIEKVFEVSERILKTLTDEDARTYRKYNHKNLITGIYTAWENLAKDIIFKTFDRNRNCFLNSQFMIKYLEDVHSKKYVKKLFQEGYSNDKITITKENLCYSNNLKSSELMEILKRVGYSTKEFGKHVNTSKKIDELLKNLADEDVIYSVKDDIKAPNKTKKVFLYLDLLVEKRNEVAHQYDIADLFNLKQLVVILNFIKELTNILYEFCLSQIIIKAKDCDKAVNKRIMPLVVFKGSSSEKSAIVGVRNISIKSIDENSIFLLYDNNLKIYSIANIISIMEGRCVVDRMYPYQEYSLEIKSNVSIQKNHKKFFNLSVLQTSIIRMGYDIKVL